MSFSSSHQSAPEVTVASSFYEGAAPSAFRLGDAPYQIIRTAPSTVNSETTPHCIYFAPSFGYGDCRRVPEEDDKHQFVRIHRNEPQWIKWSRIAADSLAKELGLWSEANHHWILDDFPTGYTLWDQRMPSDSRTSSTTGVRSDRMVFGHPGKRIRSAMALGRHISWMLRSAPYACTCGCDATLDSIKVPYAPSSSTSKTKAQSLGDSVRDSSSSASSNSATAVAAPRKKPARPQARASRVAKPTQVNPYARPYTTTNRGTSKRNGATPPLNHRPPISSPDGSPPISISNGKVHKVHEFDAIPRVSADTSVIAADGVREQRDPASRGWARVGDVVWTWVGAQAAGWWPSVIVDSDMTNVYELPNGVKEWGEERKIVTVELLGLGEERSGVELAFLKPWLAYQPQDLRVQSDAPWEEVARRQTVAELVLGGSAAVNKAFVLAWRVGKWVASIQLRSPPSIQYGRHLVVSLAPVAAATPLQRLVPSLSGAPYLSHAWIADGPEVLHLGDLVRLSPSVDLGHLLAAGPGYKKSTCLMLRISEFLRGGKGCPLLARGRLFQMLEDDKIPSETAGGPEPPVPGFRWNCISPTVDILVEHIAGRYLPLGDAELDQLLKDAVAGQAREDAVRRLGLGGVVCRGWESVFPAITAPNSVIGGEDERLAVAEDAAMLDLIEWRAGGLKAAQPVGL